MSGPLELYRTTVNLRGLGSGCEIEIDPTDPAWAGDIAKRRIVKVEQLPEATVTVHPADGSEPYEVEGVVEEFSSNGEGHDGARWPTEQDWHEHPVPFDPETGSYG